MKLAQPLYTALVNPEKLPNLAYIQQSLKSGKLTIDGYFSEYDKDTVWHVLAKHNEFVHHSLLQELLQHFSEYNVDNGEALQQALNSKDVRGFTPLHHAAVKRNFQAISLLVHFGANPTITDSNGLTPLYFMESSFNRHLVQDMRTLVRNYENGIKPTVIFYEPKLLKEEPIKNKRENNHFTLNIFVKRFFPWSTAHSAQNYAQIPLAPKAGQTSYSVPKAKRS